MRVSQLDISYLGRKRSVAAVVEKLGVALKSDPRSILSRMGRVQRLFGRPVRALRFFARAMEVAPAGGKSRHRPDRRWSGRGAKGARFIVPSAGKRGALALFPRGRSYAESLEERLLQPAAEVASRAGRTAAGRRKQPAKDRQERTLSMRQRKEIQEMLHARRTVSDRRFLRAEIRSPEDGELAPP